MVSYVLGAVVLASPFAALLGWIAFRFLRAFVRFQVAKRKYAAVPKMKFVQGPLLNMPIVELYFKPFGLEKYTAAVPRQAADGNFVPIYDMGSSMQGSQCLAVTDAELAKQVLTQVNDFKKFPEVYDSLKLIAGELGIVVTSGAVWKRQRRLLTPLFHFERLRLLPPVVNVHVDELFQKIDARIAAEPNHKYSAHDLMAEITMRAIISLAFGGEFDANFMITQYTALCASMRMYMLGSMLLGPLFDRLPVPQAQAPVTLRSNIESYIRKVIKERREKLSLSGSEASTAEASDLLTAMLMVRDEESGGGALSEAEIVDQAVTFLFAGFDTTSTVLSWTLYFLGQHPDIQRRVQAEVDAVLQGKCVDNVHLDQMTFMHNVLNEVLRHRPVSVTIDREATRDLQLGEYAIVKGTEISVDLYALHHSPKYWTDPDVFNPDRWDSDETRHPFAWVPFSAGPRNCIGKNFAQREMMIILGMIMQRYSVECVVDGPEDQVRMEFVVVLEPVGLKLRFSHRNASGAK